MNDFEKKNHCCTRWYHHQTITLEKKGAQFYISLMYRVNSITLEREGAQLCISLLYKLNCKGERVVPSGTVSYVVNILFILTFFIQISRKRNDIVKQIRQKEGI